ncbi:MAG TPA: hypothetical protein VFL59_10280 [Candidatus Nanopelagicales bacterium]|nr:hypothetical protein [Candidatus Nanopelagicales bacterium]
MTQSTEARGRRDDGDPRSTSTVDLLWIPLGAGASLPTVRVSGAIYETITAAREHRPRLALYHAALEVETDARSYVLEMTPAWGPAHQPGAAVAGGPVGTRALGRSRLFRYEVHCSPGATIPDREHAVETIRVAEGDDDVARRVIGLAPYVPDATWGRDELHAGEMWNSNSIVAWLLARAGADVARLAPPAGGRAPGWAAGLAIATDPPPLR